MAKKTRTVENAELMQTSGAIEIFSSSRGISLRERLEKQEDKEGQYLPYIFMGNPKNTQHPHYTLAMRSGQEMQTCQEPEIVHFWSQEVARRLEGSKYTDRVYAHKNPEEYRKIAAENPVGWTHGLVHIVYVSTSEFFGFYTFETFGLQEKYWLSLLAAASIQEKKKAKVKITDHVVNKVESKSGFEYLMPEKFVQWEIESLEARDLEEMREAYESVKVLLRDFVSE